MSVKGLQALIGRRSLEEDDSLVEKIDQMEALLAAKKADVAAFELKIQTLLEDRQMQIETNAALLKSLE